MICWLKPSFLLHKPELDINSLPFPFQVPSSRLSLPLLLAYNLLGCTLTVWLSCVSRWKCLWWAEDLASPVKDHSIDCSQFSTAPKVGRIGSLPDGHMLSAVTIAFYNEAPPPRCNSKRCQYFSMKFKLQGDVSDSPDMAVLIFCLMTRSIVEGSVAQPSINGENEITGKQLTPLVCPLVSIKA